MLEELTAKLTYAPTLLLHSCCAPCSSSVIETLANNFVITVFYYNPNIDPQQEYRKRADEQKRFLTQISANYPVAYLEGAYESQAFDSACIGLENEPEGGLRCKSCFQLRLLKTAQTAKAQQFEYFGTTLSVSPHKNAQLLNELGEKIGNENGVPFLPADFKKKNGYLRSIQLAKEYDLYRQEYCGCKYSV